MFQFKKTEPTPTTPAKLALPQPVFDRAKIIAEENSVDVDAVLVQALEHALLGKRSRKAKGKAQVAR